MQKKKTEKEKLKAESRGKLKAKLRWGDVSLIAKVAEVNRSTVERWFGGSTDNASVKESVEKLIEKRKEKISSRLNDLM